MFNIRTTIKEAATLMRNPDFFVCTGFEKNPARVALRIFPLAITPGGLHQETLRSWTRALYRGVSVGHACGKFTLVTALES